MSKIESWGVWSFLTVDIEGRVYYHVKCVCDNGDLSRQINNFKSPQLWQLDNDTQLVSALVYNTIPGSNVHSHEANELGGRIPTSRFESQEAVGSWKQISAKNTRKTHENFGHLKMEMSFFPTSVIFRWLCWFHESLVVLSTSLAFLVANCCKLQINCRCTPPPFLFC